MRLNDYYTKILESLELEVNKEGYIYYVTKEDKNLVTIGGLPVVLPTKEQLNNIYRVENNKPILSKIPFNPMNEDIVKGDTKSLKLLKQHINLRLSSRILMVGSMLLQLASDNKLQENINMEITNFLVKLNESVSSNTKKLVDDTTIKNWTELCIENTKEHGGILDIYIKKKGKLGKDDYNRITVITPTILDEIEEQTRKKDRQTLKIILNEILNLEDDVVSYGSNDITAPALHSLISLYNKITENLNRLLDGIKHVDSDYYKKSYTEIIIPKIEEYRIFDNELRMLPSENDLTRSVTKQETVSRAYPKEAVAPIKSEIKDPLARFKSINTNTVKILPINMNNNIQKIPLNNNIQKIPLNNI